MLEAIPHEHPGVHRHDLAAGLLNRCINPVRAVRPVEIVDQAEIFKREAPAISAFEADALQKQDTTVFHVPSLGPGSGDEVMRAWFDRFQVPSDVNWLCYLVTVTARNGGWRERIAARKVNGEWEVAEEIYGSYGLKKEQASAKFPRNPDGTIQFVP